MGGDFSLAPLAEPEITLSIRQLSLMRDLGLVETRRPGAAG